jgi:alpha-ketoglutarate-dependent taurine dioxygenase
MSEVRVTYQRDCFDRRCVKHIAVHNVHHAKRLMRRIQIAGDKVA